MRVAAALLVLTAFSVALRTGGLDAGFWIDEAIAVGIASHDPGEIPGLLRQDGSPPLYYLLLHGWIGLVGTGEAATRALSLVFAAVAVPASWWAGSVVGGRRAGAVAAAIVAVCPFLTHYAQEARMYTLVAVLSLVATAAFVRGRPVVLVVALTLLLYTHTWGVFLFAAFGLVWLVRDRSRGGLLVGGAVAVLYLPWVPSLVFQALHTGAPWSQPPSLLYLVPPVLAVAWRPRDDLVLVGAAGFVLAWVASQFEPAWSLRYLAVLFGPALLALVCVAARRTAWAVVAPLALVAAMLLAGPPAAKSNARAVAASVAPSVRPGDLVVCTQPEQVPVLHRYLPDVAYLTPLGTPADPSLTDWRDALPRLRAARAERVLLPRVAALGRGRRVVLVTPVARRPRAPWGRVVRRRTQEWRAALRADPRLRWIGRTSHPDPARFRSAVRAEIYEVVAPPAAPIRRALTWTS
jgi:mannosyltransferase